MENIEVTCPSCSPHVPVNHTVLKSNRDVLLQCQECGSVHVRTRPKKVYVRVIISNGKESFHRRAHLSGIIKTGDEFLVDDETTGEANLAHVTSLEVGGKRKETAPVEDIQTIWARAVDEVTVKISVNLGETTESMDIRVPGEKEFIIGEKIQVNNRKFVIKQIKIRDGGFKRRKGIAVEAKDIKRIFTDPAIPLPKKISKKGERIVIKKRVSEWSLKSRKAG